jgi:uncharacterized membrane protein
MTPAPPLSHQVINSIMRVAKIVKHNISMLIATTIWMLTMALSYAALIFTGSMLDGEKASGISVTTAWSVIGIGLVGCVLLPVVVVISNKRKN